MRNGSCQHDQDTRDHPKRHVRAGLGDFALGVAALIVDPMRLPASGRSLCCHRARRNAMGEGSFAPGAVYPTTDMEDVPPGLATRGSWLGSNSFQGSQATGCFKPRRKSR